eukprot:4450198-Pyramimonas_sp.AAC.1
MHQRCVGDAPASALCPRCRHADVKQVGLRIELHRRCIGNAARSSDPFTWTPCGRPRGPA